MTVPTGAADDLTIAGWLLHHASERAEQTALAVHPASEPWVEPGQPDGGAGSPWRAVSWTRLAAEVEAAAGQLVKRGVAAGDRVALLASSSARWTVADLAIVSIGAGVTVLEGYGSTGTAAPGAVNAPSANRIGTVGRPIGLDERVQEVVDRVNATLARSETIRRFHVVDRPFREDDDELTSTMKLRRRMILGHFADEVEALYPGRG